MTPDNENPAENAAEGPTGEGQEGEMATVQPPQQHPEQATLPAEAQNLVPALAADPKMEEWLLSETKKLVKAIKADDKSRADWLKNRTDETELYAGTKSNNAMNKSMGQQPHDPIMTRTLLQLWCRGIDQIFPAKGTLMQVQPTQPKDEEPAARREKHMNWQLRHKVPNWVPGHRETYLAFIMAGSTFREKSWNPVKKISEFEHITADDVIVSYSRKDIDPLMKRVPRVTRVLRPFRWEIEEYAEVGAFHGDYVENKLYGDDAAPSTGNIESEESSFTEAGQKIDGVEAPSTVSEKGGDADLSPRVLWRCQTWMRLPKDKKMKPVTITIDVKTSTPLALVVRESEDPFERMQFEAKKQEWEMQAQAVAAQFQQQVQQIQMMQQQGVPAQMPQQPQPPPIPQPPKLRPVYNIFHYRLFPNPAGFYGIGAGYLLRNANLMVNKLQAEYLQSARAANTSGGWLPKGTMLKTGPIEMEFGKYHQTELEAEQMTGIKTLQFPPPADGLWKFIKNLEDACYSLIADVDTMSGQAGPTNETKAAAQQRNYNATALISVISGLYLDTLKEEVKALAHDNRMFMDDTEYFWVTEPTHQDPAKAQQQGGGQAQTALRSDYTDEFDFTFTADQRLQSQPDRIAAMQSVIQTVISIPALAQDPMKGPPLFYAALLKMFRAMDVPELEAALGPAPPAPTPEPPPPQPLSQVDENAMFFADKDHPVLPQDDHQGHLIAMEDLETSPYYEHMSSTGKQFFQLHKQTHFGELYKQQAAIAQQGGQALGLRPEPGMGAGPRDGGLPQGAQPPPQGGPPQGAQPMPNGGQPA